MTNLHCEANISTSATFAVMANATGHSFVQLELKVRLMPALSAYSYQASIHAKHLCSGLSNYQVSPEVIRRAENFGGDSSVV